jgi:hypothetical protein
LHRTLASIPSFVKQHRPQYPARSQIIPQTNLIKFPKATYMLESFCLLVRAHFEVTHTALYHLDILGHRSPKMDLRRSDVCRCHVILRTFQGLFHGCFPCVDFCILLKNESVQLRRF